MKSPKNLIGRGKIMSSSTVPIFVERPYLRYGRSVTVFMGILYLIGGLLIGYGGCLYVWSFEMIPFFLGVWLLGMACIFIFAGFWSVSFLKKDMDELKILFDGIVLPRKTLKDILLMKGPYISFKDITAIYTNSADRELPYILIIHKKRGPISLYKRYYRKLSDPALMRSLIPLDIPVILNKNLTYWEAKKKFRPKDSYSVAFS